MQIGPIAPRWIAPMQTETAAVPSFSLPDFNEVDAAFGADNKDYLTFAQMGEQFYRGHHPMCHVAQSLFFKGGKLSDYGLKLKPEIDQRKAKIAIMALLSSFAPKHEVKIGTVGVALANWCEPISKAA